MKPSEPGSIQYLPRGPRLTPTIDDRANPLRGAWRQRWVILLSILAGVAGAAAYLRRATPIYSSVGRLYVQRSIPRIATDPLNNLPESSNYLYTQCEIIKSIGVLGEVAKSPKIAQLASLSDARTRTVTLQEHLKAEVDSRNDLISVSYESPSVSDAAVVVNAVIDEYISFTARQHHNSAAEVLRNLEKEKVGRDAQLSSQLEKMKQFKQANPALFFTSDDHRGNLVIATLNRLTEAQTLARLTTVDAKSAYEAAQQRARLKLPAGSVIADPLLRDELIRLEERRELLRASLGENSRDVQMVDGSIARLQDRMAEEDKAANEASIASARQAWEAVSAKQKDIEEQVRAQEKLAIAVNSAEAEYAALDADLQRTQKISDIIDSRIKELNVTEDAPPTTVAILEAARPNPKPVAPEKSRVIAAGMLLGVLLGIGLAWLRDLLLQRVGLSVDDVESALGLPVLGSVPRVSAENLPPLCGTLGDTLQGPLADAYRSIRTTIVFGTAGNFRSLLVTSPCASDGKTTAAASLAAVFAQSGQRTLLIDADLRRPSIQRLFPGRTDAGVTDVVAARVKLRHAIQPTEIEGLSVLHAGAISANASAVLSSQRFAQMMAALTPAYDKIVIDSPPMALVADGQILAADVDATVLVVRAGRSSRKAAKGAVASLAAVRATVIGLILNDQPRRRANNYYSGYSIGGVANTAANIPAVARQSD